MESQNIYHKQTSSPFELLETINKQRRFTHLYLLSLLLISLFLLIALVFLAKKPPLVIRIDKLGNTQTLDNYHVETFQITDDDIKNFTKIFLENYIGLRSDLVVAQFEQSLNMMTDEFANFHLQSMKENNTVKVIQTARVRNDVAINKMTYETANDLIYVTMEGALNTRPLDEINATPQSKKIQAQLILIKTKRSPEHAYGLSLKDIKLDVNKESEKINDNLNEVIQ